MSQKTPHHVAIVMDGNGRWAEKRGLPRVEGHRAGIDVVMKVAECCLDKGIKYLSLFAFSSENWQRPEMEVDFLMNLFVQALKKETASLDEKGVALRFTGERSKLTSELQAEMIAAESRTQANEKLILNVAVNYSGKWDILQAAKKIAMDAASKKCSIAELTEQSFASYLVTKDLPDPDLFIRTSGEQRISNFFLWQLAYTELYFCDLFWPDFTADAFEKALSSYNQRERRYGQTSRQLQENNDV